MKNELAMKKKCRKCLLIDAVCSSESIRKKMLELEGKSGNFEVYKTDHVPITINLN